MLLVALLAACGGSGSFILPEGPPDVDDTGVLPQVDPEPPVASVVAPTSLLVGDLAVFDGSGSSDPQGLELVGYAWTCSNGVTAEGPRAEFVVDVTGAWTCSLTVTSSAGLTGSGEGAVEVSVRPVADWTIMVFVNGDNNLEEAALDDMNEMESVGSTERVHIVTQIDRSASYTSADGDWEGARRFRVEADADLQTVTSPVLADLGDTDSGDGQTVIDFVAWAASTYPAERYALVLWDHGWGWYAVPGGVPRDPKKGISQDDGSHSDISIANGEFEEALAGVTQAIGQPLSLLGMDACVMQSWEIAHVSRPYADAYVASQDYVDFAGWPYDAVLADLVADPGMDEIALGEVVAHRFNEIPDTTMSVVDLAQMPALADQLDALAGALIESGRAGELLRGAAADAQGFDGSWSVDHDLADFLQNLEASTDDALVLEAVGGVASVLDEAVTSNYTYGRAVEDARGLSIYTPTNGRVDDLYLQGSWSDDTLWDDLLLAAGD
jgi:hypothetical protein